MLIPARYLVDRMRHPRSRAEELRTLRTRLAEAPADAPPEDIALAREMLALRRELSELLKGAVTACGQCARGHPLPNGRWSGGHCCGTRTDAVYSDEEVEALRLSGTTAGALTAPRGDHAGCSFRGERGCSLAADHRPSLCVSYVCNELRQELLDSGQFERVSKLRSRLDAARRKFRVRREERLGS